ncbi:MAG: hypothetical protein ND895_28320 [Pyrinomonadaceae bacterium]|nr:hypothetical protein [Pyrinomonadaceae bacterium]
MPGGLSSSVNGYLVFGAVKLAGYSLAGWHLNRSYSGASANFAVVGVTRTIIGMLFGAGLALLAFPFVMFGGLGILIYIVGLVPVRLTEWWIIIWLFYDRSMMTKQKDWQYVGLGTAWSFGLDIPALIGFVATGGFWIC